MPSRQRKGHFSWGNAAVVGLSSACISIGLVASGHACGGARSDPRPQATLATTPDAGLAFAAIRQAWVAMPPLWSTSLGDGGTDATLATVPSAPANANADAGVTRAYVRSMLERFVSDYPHEPLSILAEALLSFVDMADGDLTSADRRLRVVAEVPAGTTGDVVVTARARRARLGGDSTEAMRLLTPLIGKAVDPIARALFQEELAMTAIDLRLEREAISYLDAWLRGTEGEEGIIAIGRVAGLVRGMSTALLLGELGEMRQRGGEYGYGQEIQRIIADDLARRAVEAKDAELARLLLDVDAGAVMIAGQLGADLGLLSQSRRGMNTVEGRAIGLLLPTESASRRGQSADVLRGVMWALGLPRGVRWIGRATANATDAGAPARASAPNDPAAAPCSRTIDEEDIRFVADEPKTEDQIRLVTRDHGGIVADDGTQIRGPGRAQRLAESLAQSLDELRSEGASIIVGGLDEQTADALADWAEKARFPVVTLAPLATMKPNAFTFVLGEDRVGVVSSIAQSLPSFRNGKVVPVVDPKERADFAQATKVGSMDLLAGVPCNARSERAGDPRFPISEWDQKNVREFLVTGGTTCSRDLVEELAQRGRTANVALTLEAATEIVLFRPAPGLRVMTASAGLVPLPPTIDPRDAELVSFTATFGPRLSFFTALGRDAAALARLAVKTLPTDVAPNLSVVDARRNQVRAAIAIARARLWSSEVRGFAGAQVLKRSVCVVAAKR